MGGKKLGRQTKNLPDMPNQYKNIFCHKHTQIFVRGVQAGEVANSHKFSFAAQIKSDWVGRLQPSHPTPHG
jgi:hypothetical protein